MIEFLKKILINIFQNQYKRYVYKSIDSSNIESLNKNRIIEPELLLLKNFISKGDITFDIGANIGQYTYVFERLTNSENVYSFEPIPKLHNNLSLIFSDINLSRLALSNQSSSAKFKIPLISENEYTTRGKLNVEFQEPGETSHSLIDVKTETLDNFVYKNNIKRIDFIKIDVEGHEFEVIKGSINSIKRFRPILLVEIEQRHHDFNINEIFNFLKDDYSKIEFYDLSKKKFRSFKEFDPKLNQDYLNIKTDSYINNFWFFPT